MTRIVLLFSNTISIIFVFHFLKNQIITRKHFLLLLTKNLAVRRKCGEPILAPFCVV